MKLRHMRAAVLILLLFVLLPSLVSAQDMFTRRKPQNPDQEALLVFPFPYNIPGIGGGLGFIAASANMFDTYTDLYLVYLSGDVGGAFAGLDDITLIPNFLVGGLFKQDIKRAVVPIYETRGMDSDPEQYILAEVSDVSGTGANLCLCLFEKRFAATWNYWKQGVVIENLRDKDGNVIPGFAKQSQESTYLTTGISLDLTDDYLDPRRGIQASVNTTKSLDDNSEGLEQSTLDKDLQVYVPMGKMSTLALRYLQSDAVVSREGETNKDVLAQEITGGAVSTYDQLPPEFKAQVDNSYAANKYGTAYSLGGENNLRGYPGGRFSGAASALYVAEFRWNFSEEVKPFDWYIWKDVRTTLQVAFFYELGTVADPPDALWDKTKSAYGVGFRMISLAGYAYRADFAITEEGGETILFFNYPF